MSWQSTAAAHSLRHRMDGGLFVTGTCAYCGLSTIDFCPECGIFVCRRCDTREHWPAVGIFPDVGFRFPGLAPFGRERPRRR
jgi:hypothetical protein